jgi:hypothetical protein
MAFLKNELSVFLDYVLLFGQRIDRPDYIARSTWLSHWEKIERAGAV